MVQKLLASLKDVADFQAEKQGRFWSATHDEIRAGATTDIYFINTRDVLNSVGMLDTPVTAEIFSRSTGLFAGCEEVMELLRGLPIEVEALPTGEYFSPKETVMRIRGPYGAFGIYETTMLGILSSSCAWATAARECVDAAKGKAVLSFGARHIHPSVASVMDAVAVNPGGCAGASSVLGARLCKQEPSGTIPHAAVLIMGDTLKLARAYDASIPAGIPRIYLVDTFKDECEETLRLAEALGDKLDAVRLDTPGERGGVTIDLVRETRSRLNAAGFGKVKIVVSGGLNPTRITALAEAGADTFGVGSYIAHATPMDMTMDLKEIRGQSVSKRGRLPGLVENRKLVKLQ